MKFKKKKKRFVSECLETGHKKSGLFNLEPFYGKTAYPLKVEEIFLEGLSGLSLLALVDYIRIFFVATALVVFTAMGLPVSKTHPAEVFHKRKNKTDLWTRHSTC